MKKTVLSLLIALSLCFASTLDEGAAALNKKEYEKAHKIFEDLAKENDAKAMHYLGVMYHRGNGVKKDFIRAKEWYEKAIKQ